VSSGKEKCFGKRLEVPGQEVQLRDGSFKGYRKRVPKAEQTFVFLLFH
jgi:hypothetical protein